MNRYDYLISQYPQHVVLMKEGQFYNLRKESAYIAHQLFQFRLYIARDEFCTGCPTTALSRVVRSFKEREINYIIMNREEIVEHMEFEINHYSDFKPFFEEMEEVRKKEMIRISEQALDLEVLRKTIQVIQKLTEQVLLACNKDMTVEEVFLKEGFTDQQLQESLHYAVSILNQVLSKGKVTKLKSFVQKPFHLEKECAEELITESDIKISSFVALLNKKNDDQNMKNLTATSITNWLVDSGYLVDSEKDDKKSRITTPLGESIGIKSVEREGRNGKYMINLYDQNAQKFLIDHMDLYR